MKYQQHRLSSCFDSVRLVRLRGIMWLVTRGSTYYPKQTSFIIHSPHGEHHSPDPPDNVTRTFGSE